MKPIHIPHPIFDQASLYNELRAASPATERTISYFAWLKRWRKTAERRAASLAAKEAVKVEPAAPHVVVRLDRPEEEVGLVEGSFHRSGRDPLPFRAYEVAFALADEKDYTDPGTPIRVFLLDAPHLTRLRKALGKRRRVLPREDAAAIRALFDPRLVDENRTVVELLAGLPELNGTFRTDDKGFANVSGLPKEARNVRENCWTVIVYEPFRRPLNATSE